MKVLITGGAGFIGSHTSVELLNSGYDIVILDNLSNSEEKVIHAIKQITGKEFKFYDYDIRNKEQVNSIFEENEIDGVIHFAALKSVPESVEEPLEYYDNNISGTLNVLEAIKKYNVKNLVFSSSATVYGMNNQVPYSEEMPVTATNPYGWTKVMIEQILKDYAIHDMNSKIAILRYFNPIGAHPSGLIGEKPKGIPSNLMPYICQTALGNLPYLKVCGTDYDTKDGTGVRDYIHVSDIASGHVKALEKLNKVKGVYIYNLGTGKGISVIELISTFEKVTGIPIHRKVWDRRPGDISESYADVTKANKELNWEAKLSLEQMCLDSWNYIKMNN